MFRNLTINIHKIIYDIEARIMEEDIRLQAESKLLKELINEDKNFKGISLAEFRKLHSR